MDRVNGYIYLTDRKVWNPNFIFSLMKRKNGFLCDYCLFFTLTYWLCYIIPVFYLFLICQLFSVFKNIHQAALIILIFAQTLLPNVV